MAKIIRTPTKATGGISDAERAAMSAEPLLRRYTYKLYPTSAQLAALERHRRLHCDLYNACLQQRIDQWRAECRRAGRVFAEGRWQDGRRGLTYFDQAAAVPAIRAEVDGAQEIGSTALAYTIRRVDHAMKAFFARLKRGADAYGFPRFKRGDDYAGFTCMNAVKKGRRVWNGWRWTPGPKGDGRVAVMGIPGSIKARGELPAAPLAVIGADFSLRAGTWWMSLIVEMAPRLAAADAQQGEVRFDLIDSFATVRVVDGGPAAGLEETVFAAADGRIVSRYEGVKRGPVSDTPETGADQGPVARRVRIAPVSDTPETGADQGPHVHLLVVRRVSDTPETGALQRRMARCRRGSANYRRLRRRKARREARQARQRREALHVWTTALARRFAALAIYLPALAAATASGRGDAREWGGAVEIKAALNRHILAQAPALAAQMLTYKLAERGGAAETIKDPAPSTAIGADMVAAAKALRTAQRRVKHAV